MSAETNKIIAEELQNIIGAEVWPPEKVKGSNSFLVNMGDSDLAKFFCGVFDATIEETYGSARGVLDENGVAKVVIGKEEGGLAFFGARHFPEGDKALGNFLRYFEDNLRAKMGEIEDMLLNQSPISIFTQSELEIAGKLQLQLGEFLPMLQTTNAHAP